ncbi:MAG: HAMP domain-containing protein, partial [Deltaproteobacteria bacterium]|nr:HAMP domain-containing protein [Deltaproteobacteria bacterium]
MDPAGGAVAHTFQGAFPEELGASNRLAPAEPWREGHIRALGQELRDFAVAIHGGRLGELHLGLGDQEVRDRMARVRADTLRLAMAFIAAGALAAWVFAGLLLRPLNRIADVLQRFRPGVHREEIPGSDDEIGDVAARINEVTARLHETHLQMLHAEKLASVGRLAAGVAHEINNPLSGALHCLENLRSDDGDAARRQEYYGLMADGISRAQRVVRSLLEFGRQHPPRIASVDLDAVVGKALDLMRVPFERAGVRVETRLAAGLGRVPADAHQIEQVVLNLLLNAMEAMPGGGKVTVETLATADGCRVAIRDTGPGIPPGVRAHIFDPFFTTKGAQGGSGLGLSVSLGVVERHGGRIEVSEAPGGGASFEVVLPLRPAAGPGEGACCHARSGCSSRTTSP